MINQIYICAIGNVRWAKSAGMLPVLQVHTCLAMVKIKMNWQSIKLDNTQLRNLSHDRVPLLPS